MLISLIRFLENLNISRTLSLLMSLINGINWILIFAVPLRSSSSTSYLRLGFSHLREHTFRHGFGDVLNPLSLFFALLFL